MIPLKKGDGLVLKSGERMIVDSGKLGNFDYPTPGEHSWFVPAWTEDHQYRFPTQLIAIEEVWRDGVKIYPVIEQLALM